MRRRPLLAALWSTTWAGPLASPGRALAAGDATTRAASSPSSPVLSPLAPGALATEASPAASRASTADALSGSSAPTDISHRPLRFPADHGAHPQTHVEWWYVTGWLRREAGTASSSSHLDAAAGASPALTADAPAPRPDYGFQVTFFRTRTGLGATSPSRFAARQLVFAHVALTDLAAASAAGGGRGPALLHDQRIAREGFGLAETPGPDGRQVARLQGWSLARALATPGAADTLDIDVRADRFALALRLRATQPVMLQGEDGYSQKGPLPRQASLYYSEPQLAVQGRVERRVEGERAVAVDVAGRAWLDHEWSNEYIPSEAVGWDWIGFNLFDGGALMAFRLRRPDGTALWGGGSYRDARGSQRNFAAGAVVFRPLRTWTSPRTGVRYPVEWQLETPVGAFRVAALADDQELDSRGSTGALYWEGLSALAGADGRTLGWGYLELTGYAERLKM
jgi:predicted secreted hydrolase